MTDTQALIERLEALDREAAPGDWLIADGGICAAKCPEDGGNVICCEPEVVMKASLEKWPSNARAITTLRNALPEIIAALREREGRLADAWLVEWKQGGEDWVDVHADEVRAVDQARLKGGICTPLYRATPPTGSAAAHAEVR